MSDFINPGFYEKVRLDQRGNVIDAGHLEAKDIPEHKHTLADLDADEIPEQIYSDDSSCLYFFEHTNIPYGRGVSPNDAAMDLVRRLKGVKE